MKTFNNGGPFLNHYHFIASTKLRRRIFDGAIRARLEDVMRGICKSRGFHLVAIAAAENHVHLLIQSSEKPAKIAQFLFGTSAHTLRAEYEVCRLLHPQSLWGGKSCHYVKDAGHLNEATRYINVHQPSSDLPDDFQDEEG